MAVGTNSQYAFAPGELAGALQDSQEHQPAMSTKHVSRRLETHTDNKMEHTETHDVRILCRLPTAPETQSALRADGVSRCRR